MLQKYVVNAITGDLDLVTNFNGTASQYVRGDGQLANFPTISGGGASVSYYLNGSVSQGTFGGVAMKQINKTPIIGTGTDFTINADGYIQSFITDANDPSQLQIAGGNWNFETYFSASSSGGTPSFYVELYKWDGATLTLIASNSTNPESITGGTAIDLYLTALAVPQTTLALTDRLAVRIYVTHSGRTIKLHTEDNHLSQIITTFSTGLTALNGLTAQVQNLAVGTSGTDFAISSLTSIHTFNLPTASATNRGALSSTDWSTFNSKQNTISLTTTGTSGAATLVGSTLNVPQYAGGLTYFTEAQNSAAPNATVKVDSITATASTTNADVAIVPKGTGAFTLAVPDNTTVGGNKRGTNAVDLQSIRSSNTQVASGVSSFLAGNGNTASGSYSSAIGYLNASSGAYSSAIGYGNIASNTFSYTFGSSCTASNANAIAMGNRAKATGDSSICLGNYYYADSTASGQNSIVLGYGTASANRSMALGFSALVANASSTAIGDYSNTFSTIGRIALSGGSLGNAGDNQKSVVSYRQRTTDATPTILTTNNATTFGDNAGSQLALQNQQVMRFKGSITAKKSGTTDIAVWDIDGVLVRGANAASTVLTVGNVNVVTNIPAWVTPTLAANTSVNVGGLLITITGVIATNIQWFAAIDTVENIYA